MIGVNSKKVILIYPAGEPADWHWTPWSVMGIAQTLSDNGYDPYVWDQRVQGEEELLGQLDGKVICVGISTMIGIQIKNGLAIARKIREALPDVPLVWGGPFITSNPEVAAESEMVDAAVKGQGELAMLRVLDDIKNSSCGKGSKKIYSGNIEDINAHPRWRFGLIDLNRYINPETRAMTYFTSYGCVHNCAFCSITRNRWKSLPEETIINELDHLVRTYDIKTVLFPDANFFPVQKRVRALCENIISRGLHIKWHANARADELSKFSDETLDLMIKSGCQMLLIGVETGARKLVPYVNKGESLEVIEGFIRRMAKYPISMQMLLIFALPHETPEDTMESIEFYNRLKNYNPEGIIPSPHFFIPLPGTGLFREAVKLGYVPPRSFEEWGDLDWKKIGINTWTGKDDLEEIQGLVNKHIIQAATGRGRILRSTTCQKAGGTVEGSTV